MTDKTEWRRSGGYGTRNYLYFREMFPELDDQIIDQFKLGFGATIIYEDMSREEIGKLIYNAIAIGFVSGKQQSYAASAVWDKAVEECAKQIGEDPALTDSLAAVIEAVAKDGLSHPRDTDVAIDAIRESAKMVLRSLKRSDKTESGNA